MRLASNVSLGVHLFCVMIVTPKYLTCRHIICVTAVYERPMSSILNVSFDMQLMRTLHKVLVLELSYWSVGIVTAAYVIIGKI